VVLSELYEPLSLISGKFLLWSYWSMLAYGVAV